MVLSMVWSGKNLDLLIVNIPKIFDLMIQDPGIIHNKYREEGKV